MAYFVSAGESGSVVCRVEGTELVLASQSHLEVDGREKWIADNGAINMLTGDSRRLLNLKPAPFGREYVQIRNGDFLRVLRAGSLNLVFHIDTPAREYTFRVQLSEVYVLDRLSFDLFSLHHAQRKKYIVLNDAGV